MDPHLPTPEDRMTTQRKLQAKLSMKLEIAEQMEALRKARG